uniref:Integrase catalytic domain-containing protein n=1 Tax=Cannabis sativa TaxID=3483 RepID=A0A803P466_CANSA
MVTVDYFTKWVEVEPMNMITSKKALDLVIKNIVCRFRLSQKTASDNGKQFDSNHFTDFCIQHRIMKSFSAVSQVQLKMYQGKISRHFNSKVKSHTFDVGDLVLRRVFPPLQEQGVGFKGPKWEGSYEIQHKVGNGTF